MSIEQLNNIKLFKYQLIFNFKHPMKCADRQLNSKLYVTIHGSVFTQKNISETMNHSPGIKQAVHHSKYKIPSEFISGELF